ncbi:transcription elongation factor GreA [Streptococcus thoraltensis]|uniref:transcription elongation factor GreA n=1 Tax=Streptococcus thoraltensis TaxID=55085 RepID=UPI0003636DD8|nr:transcription elongation factor GreA [Streptococcus thoraltensis]MDY4761872.1 transcription elongation factor GreA [Streptococcus thoraltensis]
MSEKTFPMTQTEKEKLEKELEELKLVRRPEVVERIKIARSYGDLSENSEYDAAKDEQAFVEGEISTLENQIRNAEIIDSDAVDKDEVAIGKTVVVQEVGTTDKDTYHIVGSAGADIFSGKISNDSPIGQALIGKNKGDKVAIESPAGSYQVEIISVEKTQDNK